MTRPKGSRNRWRKLDEDYPSLELRIQHHAYLVHKAQAKFRGEPHELTEEEYFEAWGELWTQRGKQADQYTMTRRDPELAWSRDNVEVITRREQLSRNQKFGRNIRL